MSGPAKNSSGLTVGAFALVFVGGTVGTAVRAAVDSALGDGALHAFPLHTFAINVVGSLLLGILLEHLARRGPLPSRSRLRLLLGTGALGGFTTYSALTVSTAQLLLGGFPAAAAVYALATVLLGLVAAGAGIALSARLSRGAGQTSVARLDDEPDDPPGNRP